MLSLRRKQQRSNTLLQDVSRAASRIAEESKNLADVARTELGDLGREVKDQASSGANQARRATASRLAGAAEAVEPRRRKRRKLPIFLSAVAGTAMAWRVAKQRDAARHPGEPRATDAPGSQSGESSRSAESTTASGSTGSTAPSPARQGPSTATQPKVGASAGRNSSSSPTSAGPPS